MPSVDFYRFESEFVGTNMYLAIVNNEALIIDPHFDENADKMLAGVTKTTVFLTHEHPDHTCGLPWLKEKFSVTLICSKKCAEIIAIEKNNRPYLITFVLAQKDKQKGTHLSEKFAKTVKPYAGIADITFDNEFDYKWQNLTFHFTPAAGHSQGGSLIHFGKEAVFTGDNLILNTPIITRFPGGSQLEYNTRTKPLLNAIPNGTLILPGHGRVFKKEEIQ